MRMYSSRYAAALAVVGWLAMPFAPALADDPPGVERSSEGSAQALLDGARAVRREGNVEGAGSQQRINEISGETDRLFAKYSNALRQIDSTRVYNRQMEDLVTSQREELASLSDQLNRVEEVGRSVAPLMLRMIASLEAFLALDVPFLIEERTKRVQGLREMMNRADVTISEKFRNIMEAYQIEHEYGRTIEAYRATLEKDGTELVVDFLRFGRIALLYQTIDESEAGAWNSETRSWMTLDSSYRTDIRDGLRIARKQAAPDLIRLPLPAPQSEGGTG